jgi:uncharacterized SAM-binding protein YcdF (DUF218 family)
MQRVRKFSLYRWVVAGFGLAMAGLAGFLIWGNDFLSMEAGRLGGEKADLAVVLAGAPPEDRERVLVAVDLVQAEEARLLLLPVRHRALEWSWFVRRYRIRAHLPEDRVMIGREEGSRSESWPDLGGTFAEARKTLAIMREHHFRSAIIISSNYHMRRARLAFERANQDPDLVFYFHPVDYRDPEDFDPWWWDSAYVMKVADEYIKLLAGYLFYR